MRLCTKIALAASMIGGMLIVSWIISKANHISHAEDWKRAQQEVLAEFFSTTEYMFTTPFIYDESKDSLVRKEENGNLSQNEVIKEFLRISDYDYVSKLSSNEAYHKRIQVGNLWFLPKGTIVTRDEVRRRVVNYVGGTYSLWKLTSPDMGCDCYMNGMSLTVLPITSQGISLILTRVSSGGNDSFEEIYLKEGDSITRFGPEDFHKLQLKEGDGKTFEITFPVNKSGKPRFWQIRKYYTDPSQYNRDDEMYCRRIGRTKDPTVILNFLQVTDTVYKDQAMELMCKRYFYELPTVYKSRHPGADNE